MCRAFSKYVFHKVRTPRLDFMSEKLNNALSLQKMEEGKVQLEMMTAFSMKESIAKLNSTLAGAQVTKSLHLERTVDESMGDCLF